MLTESEHVLSCLAEECAEIAEVCSRVSVRVSKALRFGLDEVQPGQPDDNAKRLLAELTDLLAVAEMLSERGLLRREDVARKKAKVGQFMEYAAGCGALTREVPADTLFDPEAVDAPKLDVVGRRANDAFHRLMFLLICFFLFWLLFARDTILP